MAISRLRPAARFENRSAMLATAMRRMRRTAAWSTSSGRRASPVITSWRGRTRVVMRVVRGSTPWNRLGRVPAQRHITARESSRARARLAPGASRPIPVMYQPNLRVGSRPRGR